MNEFYDQQLDNKLSESVMYWYVGFLNNLSEDKQKEYIMILPDTIKLIKNPSEELKLLALELKLTQ
jgi:hypothetical protein